jgi:hypothetical protein
MKNQQKNQQEVQKALESFHAQAQEAVARRATPNNAQAGLFTNFDPKKFLTELHIILGAVDQFIPAPVGPILTAIDEVLGKINAGAAPKGQTPAGK